MIPPVCGQHHFICIPVLVSKSRASVTMKEPEKVCIRLISGHCEALLSLSHDKIAPPLLTAADLICFSCIFCLISFISALLSRFFVPQVFPVFPQFFSRFLLEPPQQPSSQPVPLLRARAPFVARLSVRALLLLQEHCFNFLRHALQHGGLCF